MSLNLSAAFVRYPDVQGCAQAMESFLSARLAAQIDLPRHLCVSTGSPWIGVYAWGNSIAQDLAEHLSRHLEARAIWFGLSGRSLAYRMRTFHLGRAQADTPVPAELFGPGEDFRLPAYVDVEQALFNLLVREGIPAAYVFALAEEFGASAKGLPDAVLLAAPNWDRGRLQSEPFPHRLPRRPTGGVRTQFDRFDEEKKTVTEELVLRGLWDEARGRDLLALLQRLTLRRVVPPEWKLVFELQSPSGPALLDPLLALFERERGPRRLSYALAR